MLLTNVKLKYFLFSKTRCYRHVMSRFLKSLILQFLESIIDQYDLTDEVDESKYYYEYYFHGPVSWKLIAIYGKMIAKRVTLSILLVLGLAIPIILSLKSKFRLRILLCLAITTSILASETFDNFTC